MALATISARIDADDKRVFDSFCSSVGLTSSAALNIFVKKVILEQRIPFEIANDTFEMRLDEADRAAEQSSVRHTAEEAFAAARRRIHAE